MGDFPWALLFPCFPLIICRTILPASFFPSSSLKDEVKASNAAIK